METELGWAQAMIHYAINYPGVTPPTMTTSDLEEVVFGLFPRKVITHRGDAAEIIQELRAFWHFLERVYQLPQARQMLAHLTPQAARRLERERPRASQLWHGQVLCPDGRRGGL